MSDFKQISFATPGITTIEPGVGVGAVLTQLGQRWGLVSYALGVIDLFQRRGTRITDETIPIVWITHEGAWITVITQLAQMLCDPPKSGKFSNRSVQALLTSVDDADVHTLWTSLRRSHKDTIDAIKDARHKTVAHADDETLSSYSPLKSIDVDRCRALTADLGELLRSAAKSHRFMLSLHELEPVEIDEDFHGFPF
ncbi:MAG: hypothetical protein AAF747_08060 [Planctomycetota bacterium]